MSPPPGGCSPTLLVCEDQRCHQRCSCATVPPTPSATPTCPPPPAAPTCAPGTTYLCRDECRVDCFCATATPTPSPSPTSTGECRPTVPPPCDDGETAVCSEYRCAVGCDCACTGDCDRNGVVAIDEIVTAVTMALNGDFYPTGCFAALCGCRPGSFCQNSGVTIECLVRAVGHALDGCPGEVATPTVTRSPSSTPTIPAALALVCGSELDERREVIASEGADSITCANGNGDCWQADFNAARVNSAQLFSAATN